MPDVDFELAQLFFDQAREAYSVKDERRFAAARHLLMVALGGGKQPSVNGAIHTAHLAGDDAR